MSRTGSAVKGHAAAVAGVLLLAGCTALQPVQEATPAQSPPARPGPLLPVSPPALRPPDARWLEGLSPADVQRRMGEADFVRMEPGAHIMQYRGAGCIIDVIFQTDRTPPGSFRVGHLAARRISGAVTSVDDCLPDLVPPAQWPVAR